MNENTQNVEADLEERLQGFNNELKPLLGKYELGVAALPKIMPNGTIGADPVIVSMRQKVEEKPVDTTPEDEKVSDEVQEVLNAAEPLAE